MQTVVLLERLKTLMTAMMTGYLRVPQRGVRTVNSGEFLAPPLLVRV
jgi:hypothetical protein